ncbi:MAG: ABC transporter substrate-binding protein [Chloroflexi bacterium]|nr:MAG: ABC transporter substrate-binding protein [Chloroflexota bacterium]
MKRPSLPENTARLALLAALAMVAGACGPGASASPSGAASSASPASAATPTKLTVGLGFIPSVQFAQFYLAQSAGYYRDAGLDVTFQNKIDPDLITLVGQGSVDIGIADGTSVIPAVAQGIPVRYVTTIYAQFPNIVYAKASSGIHGAADLRGKKLGTPGKYGSSWIMLQALLGSAGLKPADLDIQLYPDFGQGAALAQGAVTAATGFVNNEPVQLELSGTPAVVLHVDDTVPLPGNGLIAGVDTLRTKRAALQAFVAATLHAMAEITADPQKGLDAAVAAVPDLGKDRPTQLAILKATIGTWSNAYTQAHGAGAIDRSAWSSTVSFMAGLADTPLPGSPPPVDQLVDDSLLK